MTDDDPNTAFLRYKSRHSATWTLVNLLRTDQHPCATRLGQPLAGHEVVVCGAGASLADSLDELQTFGGPILAVNKSAVVLRKHGIEPWAVIARESIDVSAQLDGTSLVAADISAHPRVWEAAGDRLAWFLPGYPRHFGACSLLGVVPTFGGTAAFTTAVHLARVWGASGITLVGADLSLTPQDDGTFTSYHPDAPRGTLRAKKVGDRLHFSGGEDDDELCVDSGQPPQPKVVSYHELPSLRWGGLRPLLHTHADEHYWLVTEASRHASTVRYRNATHDGIGIPGWEWVSALPKGTPAAPPDMGHRVGEETHRALLDDLRAQADRLETVGDELVNGPDLARLATLDLWRGAPLIEMLAAGRQLDAPTEPRERCIHAYRALGEAARETKAIMVGAGL